MTQLTKNHIKKLVSYFYQKVQNDEMLGPIFNKVAKVDWDHHILLICQFWNSIMLKTNEYDGNAYRKHVILGEKVNLTEEHFTRWLMLFQEEAFKHLPETEAQLITDKATMIAASLKMGAIRKCRANNLPLT
ncbi:MAG: globin [Gammaproteobacteria bacterium CG_4_10_14_0_8_um_filter_38_16]|nr:MAG: globin [Gammaproteobacteria bacterium CG_4_10_14_0_8_um_filter_38_16]PJA02851.1 MAG: globin [Gammaproteobacteria bacterium CG_4_10_14_0_2_um_filter_38_22]PJB10689.1 MAG: globin [Gammaproteobacteria bacterium CG_4_9_14_3_um_filter_38_9]